jgi:hypothetical protein
MAKDENYRELVTRLSTALTMTEAALMWRPRGGGVVAQELPYLGE